MRFGIVRKKIHAAASHVALGHVDDAAEGQIVLGVDHAQIAERVLDLGAVEKLHAAVNMIRQLFGDEGLLHRPCDMMRAVQHGDVAIGHALVVKAAHALHDRHGFVGGVFGEAEAHRLAA